MSEGMPWTSGRALSALLFVFLVGLLGFALLLIENSLGWLFLFLATWFVVGLVYTASGGGEGDRP